MFLNSIRSSFSFATPQDEYRPHIDGLRALAVVLVVIFHYAPSYLQGGFIGVDVFFVISGYLITGILHQSFAGHSFVFALKKFYQNRIRRIFPAALLILAFLFIVGWVTLFSYEFDLLAKHIVASSGFVENFLLWSEAGYFDGEAIKKPLLHFWSLAVEEQFYIFWPLALWFIVRRNLPLLPIITAIIIVSFVVNVASIFFGHATSAFYLPVARTWELMVGAWLAIAQRQGVAWINKYPKSQSWIGLILVMIGVLIIGSESKFPGFYAILPVLGTALLINAGHVGVINAKVASWKPIVWIGTISYPLYLWHWALLSMVAVIYEQRLPGMSWGRAKIILAIASVVLAWLTYRLIETPIRRRGKNRAVVVLLSGMLFIVAMSVYVIAGDGIQNRSFAFVNNSYSAMNYIRSMDRSPLEGDCYNLNSKVSILGQNLPDKFYCTLGDKGADTFVVAYGDSHSLSMIPVLDKFGLDNGVQIAYSGIDSCLPIIGATKFYGKQKACDELAARMIQLAKKKSAKAAIFIQNWPNYLGDMATTLNDGQKITGIPALLHGLEATINSYREEGVKVIFVEDNPGQRMTLPIDKIRFDDNLDDRSINSLSISFHDYLKQQHKVNDLLENLAALHVGVSVINNANIFCDGDVCPVAKDGKFLYYDSGHLSTFGAMQTYDNIESILVREIARVEIGSIVEK